MPKSQQSSIIIPIRLSMSTIFLISCDDGYLQIDTGYEKDYPLYLRNLRRAGVTLDEIRFLFLSHHHDDHAGFLNDLTRDTNVTIIAHQESIELLATGENDKTRGGGYVSRIVKVLADLKMRLDPEWTLTFPPFKIRSNDILISGDDNRRLRQLGISGKILYTPGHCIDHIALVLDSGEVFCGDAAADMLRWAGTKYCTVFMTHMLDGYRSWEKMLNNGTTIIYPAHGKPFPSQKLRQNLGRIRNQDLVKFF